jgi:glutamate-1-semialdehyde 2,1-aminomutase
VIFEATGTHWGTDPIDLAYVRRLVDAAHAVGALVIFDEVITGFRVTPGGAQREYGITPDLTTLAKILGGGLPGGAVAGRADILEQIAMRADGGRYAGGRIQHPGTYNANPLSASAGIACLSLAADGTHQSKAAATAADLARRLNAVFTEESVPGAVYGQSSMLHIAIGMEQQPPDGYSWGWSPLPQRPPPVAPATAQALRNAMLNEGVDLMGNGLMVSSAHTPDDVEATANAFRSSLRAMKSDGLLR